MYKNIREIIIYLHFKKINLELWNSMRDNDI